MLAERRAFEMREQQSRWSLVTIQPSVVQGPPPGMLSSHHCFSDYNSLSPSCCLSAMSHAQYHCVERSPWWRYFRSIRPFCVRLQGVFWRQWHGTKAQRACWQAM